MSHDLASPAVYVERAFGAARLIMALIPLGLARVLAAIRRSYAALIDPNKHFEICKAFYAHFRLTSSHRGNEPTSRAESTAVEDAAGDRRRVSDAVESFRNDVEVGR